MKEIKFRIIHNGQTYYWGYVESGFAGIPISTTMNIELAKELSCQFTGLLDKNGKEGYHKDICLYKDDSGIIQKGIIEWRDSGARFYLEAIGGDDEGNQDGYLENGEFEIIGNAFENGDLLK